MFKKLFFISLIFGLSSISFASQREQQRPIFDPGSAQELRRSSSGGAAAMQPDHKAIAELDIKYNNEQTSPIRVLNNAEFIESVMPFFKIDGSNPLALYNSLNEIAPFFFVSKNFASIVIQFFKDSKINIEATDILGQTALHIASAYQNHDVAKLLITLGANVNASTNLRIPTKEARPNNETRKLMMEKLPLISNFFYKLNYKDNYVYIKYHINDTYYSLSNFTPLHFAKLNDDFKMVNILTTCKFKFPNEEAILNTYTITHDGLASSYSDIPFSKIK